MIRMAMAVKPGDLPRVRNAYLQCESMAVGSAPRRSRQGSCRVRAMRAKFLYVVYIYNLAMTMSDQNPKLRVRKRDHCVPKLECLAVSPDCGIPLFPGGPFAAKPRLRTNRRTP